jgi:hypothetical protein
MVSKISIISLRAIKSNIRSSQSVIHTIYNSMLILFQTVSVSSVHSMKLKLFHFYIVNSSKSELRVIEIKMIIS